MRRIRIVEPGLLSTVQDRGRFGHSASGVGPAGAADTLSLRTGNRLLGNDENAAAIEMTLRGATIAFEDDAVVCLVGGTAPQAKLSRDGTERPLGMWSPTPVRAGSTLAIGPITGGSRAYLCLDGGIASEPVLGSRATHVPSAVGPPMLRKNTTLPLGEPVRGVLLAPLDASLRGAIERALTRRTLRITPGAQHDRFPDASRDALVASEYTVSDHADRAGIRLSGPAIDTPGASMRSEAVLTGAIQITPDGLPLVLFVDRPTTGGYPVLATVIHADLPALGQVRARDPVRFDWVTRAEARDASEELEQLIGSVPRPRPTTHGTRGPAS